MQAILLIFQRYVLTHMPTSSFCMSVDIIARWVCRAAPMNATQMRQHAKRHKAEAAGQNPSPSGIALPWSQVLMCMVQGSGVYDTLNMSEGLLKVIQVLAPNYFSTA